MWIDYDALTNFQTDFNFEPTNLIEVSVSLSALLSRESESASSRQNRCIEYLECNVSLIIWELNTVPNESFIVTNLQSHQDESSTVLSNLRFRVVLIDRDRMLVQMTDNDHNIQETLNSEVEGLFSNIDQTTSANDEQYNNFMTNTAHFSEQLNRYIRSNDEILTIHEKLDQLEGYLRILALHIINITPISDSNDSSTFTNKCLIS
ncbi:13379_t:CDS:2 [Funneliformis caledonium]|uniref:13379_t:CDS:1 n=1 Tax=Funneliformis caledonium TaxID=1117310 RepID=A0A9N9CP96_9GLOM|nr:13379_t:CDS:2 [Funneliformis caledonium]